MVVRIHYIYIKKKKISFKEDISDLYKTPKFFFFWSSVMDSILFI